MNADVVNFKNEKVGAIELPEKLFSVRWSAAAVKQVLQDQLANARIPWAHAKNRSEVRGGGRKPWRQKGTGRARHGSTRSPIWIGGGKSHGPRNDRDYSQKVNRKMKYAAIAMVFSRKLKEGNLKLVDAMAIEAPKTKMLASQLAHFSPDAGKKKKFDILMIPQTENKALARAGRNLPKAKVIYPGSLNIYDLLNHKDILIESPAVAAIAKHYHLSG